MTRDRSDQGPKWTPTHCTITGPCLRMRHRPSARTLQHVTVPIRNIYQEDYDHTSKENRLQRKSAYRKYLTMTIMPVTKRNQVHTHKNYSNNSYRDLYIPFYINLRNYAIKKLFIFTLNHRFQFIIPFIRSFSMHCCLLIGAATATINRLFGRLTLLQVKKRNL